MTSALNARGLAVLAPLLLLLSGFLRLSVGPR